VPTTITGSDTPAAGTSTVDAGDVGVADLNAYQITFQVTALGANTIAISGKGPGGEYDATPVAAALANDGVVVVGKEDDAYYTEYQFVASAGTAHVIHWTAIRKNEYLR